ncbi:putative E3 ubiquitin-protein ligase pub3 [Blattamonas nauphoetae]|uniref:HECT-type E3 ubiquitin transferase n=1 Tax=Blattamonas nauphoetae TaxID=2049346 RepID=A0ABQ9XIN3_9EUKA|nr:putative E3 ubiquitin-protein ligase pub3 [Blattamonas nauphoetae]
MGQQESRQSAPTVANQNTVQWVEGGLNQIPLDYVKGGKLKNLDLGWNCITSIDELLSHSKELQKLELSHNFLTSLPSNLTPFSGLKLLDLSDNQLERIPNSINTLTKLETLNLKNNLLTELPPSIGSLTHLTGLDLSGNRLVDLPDSFGDLHLHSLLLWNNTCLVDSLARITSSGADCARHILGFIRYRRSHPLPSRFSLIQSNIEGVVCYADKETETSSWVDPRYYLYILTLGIVERRVFDFSMAPSNLASLQVEMALLNTNAGRGNKRCGHISPDLAPILLPVQPQLLCSNNLCTHKANMQCGFLFCDVCCTSKECVVHGKSIKARSHHEFNERAETTRKTIESMHKPEPEAFRDKPRLRLSLRRTHLLEDSLRDMMRANAERLKLRLNVQYFGESGLDWGGLTREWFILISQEFTKPEYALFRPTADNPNVFEINPESGVNGAHLSYFRFVGRVLAKALFDRFLISAYFSPVIYKAIAGVAPTFEDLAKIDQQKYESLKTVLTTDDVEDLYLTFSIDEEAFGEVRTVELVPGGESIDVTKENQQDWVAKMTEYYLVGSVAEQLECIRYGFNELIPSSLIRDFTAREIEELLSGIVEIDVEDWKANTIYSIYTVNSQMVIWFWRIIERMNNDNRTKVFQFVTGTSKVPQGGFANLVGHNGPRKFTINKLNKSREHLPSSHTCFNQLDLIDYGSESELEDKLMKAIEMGLTGFGEK